MIKTQLKKLTAADLLASEEFENNVVEYMRQLTEQRHDEVNRLKRHGQRAKSTLFDWLEEQGLTLVQPFIEAYLQVLEKKSGYTVRERTLIHAIGMEAYRRTLLELKNTEKNEENLK